jgi:hypothetical protein
VSEAARFSKLAAPENPDHGGDRRARG